MNGTVTSRPYVEQKVRIKSPRYAQQINHLISTQMPGVLIVDPPARRPHTIPVVADLHRRIDLGGLIPEELLPPFLALPVPPLQPNIPPLLPQGGIPRHRCRQQEMLRADEVLLSNSSFLERYQALRL